MMPNLGRRGRMRRESCRGKDGILQSYEPKFVALMKWMKCMVKDLRGTSISLRSKKLEPAEFRETGRGLKCLRKVSSGDVIVSIPSVLMITPHSVLKSPLGFIIKRSSTQFSPQQLLTMFLVIEHSKDEQSKWKPYLDSLPQVYSTPLYFSQTEIDLLPPRVKDLALKSRKRFEQACIKIQEFVIHHLTSYIKEFAPQCVFSKHSLCWAWSSVNTRSVYLETAHHPCIVMDPDESNMAMAPFLDLLNHKDSAKISAGLSTDGSSYDIISFSEYTRYSQVFINYGAHDNSKLLVEYGFTLPNNSNNCFVFDLDSVIHHCASENQGKSLMRKQDILKQAGLDRQLVCTQDGVSWSLMTSIKILILEWDDLPKWKQLIQFGCISEENTHIANVKATHLVKEALLNSQRHLKLVMSPPQSTHRDSILSLAQDDVNILEHSLSLLMSDQRSNSQT